MAARYFYDRNLPVTPEEQQVELPAWRQLQVLTQDCELLLRIGPVGASNATPGGHTVRLDHNQARLLLARLRAAIEKVEDDVAALAGR